ncbi:MAG: 16S rRNA (cytosine(1402)-N(4))-methyltransferase RsmH [Bacteroidales bacterium]|nr:16S rRNA (cytosine(1402)-N(4))-methyltransferase RsmH [Bacteroidales bacterium]
MSMYHVPILLNEVIHGLQIKKGGVYVDMTFGSGKYSKAILDAERKVNVIAFDCDSDALANKWQDKRLKLFHANFRFFNHFLDYLNIEKIDGIVADLGVSSHQFDTAERGFSFRFNTKLDLRMNSHAKFDATTIINTYSFDELNKILFEYGEIKESKLIAKEIIAIREQKPITTTQQLVELLKPYVKNGKEHKFYAKVFQALRIEVNDELNALKEMLNKSIDYLNTGARFCIVTYHSLEDGIVKNFFRTGNTDGLITKDVKGNVVGEVFRNITKKPITPNEQELHENQRARSAKLRIAERL